MITRLCDQVRNVVYRDAIKDQHRNEQQNAQCIHNSRKDRPWSNSSSLGVIAKTISASSRIWFVRTRLIRRQCHQHRPFSPHTEAGTSDSAQIIALPPVAQASQHLPSGGRRKAGAAATAALMGLAKTARLSLRPRPDRDDRPQASADPDAEDMMSESDWFEKFAAAAAGDQTDPVEPGE